MSVLNNINSNSLYDVSILTDGNNNVQFTDPVESANILPPFTTTNANNILGVNTNGTQLEYKQNELLPTINGLVSGRILSNNGTNALWVLNPAPDLTQFHNLIDGSVSAPTLSQASDSTTGIYFNTQEVDVSIAGTKQLGITSTGINSSLMTSSNGYVHTGAPAFNNLSIKNGSTGTTGVFCRESTSNVGIICNGASAINCLTTGTTITTQTTTPKIILTQTASTTDPQIQSSNDLAPKCGINILEGEIDCVIEGANALTLSNSTLQIYKSTTVNSSLYTTGQILAPSGTGSAGGFSFTGFTGTGLRYNSGLQMQVTSSTIQQWGTNIIYMFQPVQISSEINPITSRTGTVTAANSDNKVQKLNYTSADCIYILPTGLNDGATTSLMPFKTSGAFNCYLQVGSGITITTLIGGVKTSYTSGNIALTEGYIYTCIYQSSITQWYVWRSS